MIEKKDILTTFKNRHARKLFDTDKKVCNEDMTFILTVAQLAPSSFGFETWQFVVVQNQELRTKTNINHI